MNCKTIVGIFGVSGSGKSTLLSLIQQSHPEWCCLEGSQVIAKVMKEQDENMNDFYEKSDTEKTIIRARAIKMIQGDSLGVTIVAGHCSFPVVAKSGEETNATEPIEFNDIFTASDGDLFDIILYLDKDPEEVYMHRKNDNETSKRERAYLSVEAIKQWIEHEKKVLEEKCTRHNIDFSLVSDEDMIEQYMATRVLDPLVLRLQAESHLALKTELEKIPESDVFLLIDGDRTLCPVDTGKLFTDKALPEHDDPLKMIFKRYDFYCFQAFIEVAMFYANALSTHEYQALSLSIAKNEVVIYKQWLQLLARLPPTTHAIVLTSGNREIWQAALDSNELTRATLLAGNHVGLHSYIIDSEAKATVVRELRQLHGGCKIFSFGDSAVDIPMLSLSDYPYIVIDDRQNRSMKDYISKEASSGSRCRFHQLNLIPDSTFLHSGVQVGSLEQLGEDITNANFDKVLDCSKTSAAARILATQSRRSDLSGPMLQVVHAQIGRFLAEKLLDNYGHFGALLDEDIFPHVQGSSFQGVVASENVLILPLMRGGEPMSRGVFECFPRSKLIHYDDKDVASSKTVESVLVSTNIMDIILVDSVVNQGRSIRRCLASLEKKKRIRIYVLTAVIQQEASVNLPKEYPRVKFLALRVSENKYTGKGGTDTGNRLFGTF